MSQLLRAGEIFKFQVKIFSYDQERQNLLIDVKSKDYSLLYSKPYSVTEIKTKEVLDTYTLDLQKVIPDIQYIKLETNVGYLI